MDKANNKVKEGGLMGFYTKKRIAIVIVVIIVVTATIALLKYFL